MRIGFCSGFRSGESQSLLKLKILKQVSIMYALIFVVFFFIHKLLVLTGILVPEVVGNFNFSVKRWRS